MFSLGLSPLFPACKITVRQGPYFEVQKEMKRELFVLQKKETIIFLPFHTTYYKRLLRRVKVLQRTFEIYSEWQGGILKRQNSVTLGCFFLVKGTNF